MAVTAVSCSRVAWVVVALGMMLAETHGLVPSSRPAAAARGSRSPKPGFGRPRPLWGGEDDQPSDVDDGSGDSVWDDAAPATTADVQGLKLELYRAAGGLNRGINARELERARVLELVRSLEEVSIGERSFAPCRGGSGPPIAQGEWRLLFTTALDVLLVGTSPLAEVGQIFQNIYLLPDDARVENVIELQPKVAAVLNPLVGSSMTRLRVTASATVESDARIRIAFRKVGLEAVSLFGTDLSTLLPDSVRSFGLDLAGALRGDGGDPSQSAGYFDTTFCDDDLRISRSNNGDVFVLVRA